MPPRSDVTRSDLRFPDVTLAILAGGKGRRLGGVAKGLLVLEGRPVLERLLELAPRVGEVLLVTPDPAPYAAFAVRTVTDERPGLGAPGGLCAALTAARGPWVLVVACDMPFVAAAAVEVLAAARDASCDAVLFEVGGRRQPLLALYRSRLAATFVSHLPAVHLPVGPPRRAPSLEGLLAGVRTRTLPEAALRAVDARLLSVEGLNTPDDLVRLGVERPAGAPLAVP